MSIGWIIVLCIACPPLILVFVVWFALRKLYRAGIEFIQQEVQPVKLDTSINDRRIMDDIDRQIERDELLLATQLAFRKPVHVPTGRCLNCEENIPLGFYCDDGCRDDYEKRQRLELHRR